MSSGQSARNGNSVEPGLPNTFLIPKARNRPNVASRTLTDLVVLAGLRDDMAKSSNPSTVVASEAKQSSFLRRNKEVGLLRRYAPRNDGGWCYHVATPFIVGWPCAFAVQMSRPPEPLSLA